MFYYFLRPGKLNLFSVEGSRIRIKTYEILKKVKVSAQFLWIRLNKFTLSRLIHKLKILKLKTKFFFYNSFVKVSPTALNSCNFTSRFTSCKSRMLSKKTLPSVLFLSEIKERKKHKSSAVHESFCPCQE